MGGPTSGPKKRIKRPVAELVPPIWERQPTETGQAWDAYRIYRDLGPRKRSHRMVAATLGKTAGYLNRLAVWAAEFSWLKRVTAWDSHKDKVSCDAELDEVCEMKRRHIRISMTLQSIGCAEAEKLDRFVKRVENKTQRVLTATELLKLLELGTRLERQSRDEPDIVIGRKARDKERAELHAILSDPGVLEEIDKIVNDAASKKG